MALVDLEGLSLCLTLSGVLISVTAKELSKLVVLLTLRPLPDMVLSSYFLISSGVASKGLTWFSLLMIGF